METSDFSYDLPGELIAQRPPARRDGARMLIIDRSTGVFRHECFRDVREHLRPGDHLILNDTRVTPARLRATRIDSGGAVEILLLEQEPDGDWDALLKASNRPPPGARFLLQDGSSTFTFLEDGDRGRCRLGFPPDVNVAELTEKYGEVPFPPYIGQQDTAPGARREDGNRYQTVYARHPGAVAAPTAGLHFTESLLKGLESTGIEHSRITLHVGIGTFRPVSASRVEDHRMDEERFSVSAETAARINDTRHAGGRIIAVGTTVVRTLETVATTTGAAREGAGRSSLFIHPPFAFRCVDALLTNFHLPESTLLMLVCAFAGRELVLDAYEEAIRQRYRFYSYGDCMLIV